MPYDENLAERVRQALGAQAGFVEKKMFGGLCFLLNGNMCCGVREDDLIVRVGPGQYAELVEQPHARPMDLTGRALKGLIYVGPGGYQTDDALSLWLKRGVDFAASLPKK